MRASHVDRGKATDSPVPIFVHCSGCPPLLTLTAGSAVSGETLSLRWLTCQFYTYDTRTVYQVPLTMPSGATSTMMPHLKPLSPVTVTPTRAFKASAPLSFLEKIDHVEINRTIVRDGVVYYVLDVFLEHSTSRIPTNKTAKSTANGRPDYQLERRFNDFADLRYQVWAYAQRKHQEGCTSCKYCDAFMSYIVHSMSQPRLFVKLATGVDSRKRLMTTFCNEFLSMTIGSKTESRPRNVTCDGFQSIPYLVQHFFSRDSSATVTHN